jgi:hypothetical protein
MTAPGLGPSVKSAIRSLWDGKATLRKPYSTSSINEYARWQTGLTARPVSKFPAPHFESPASGEEPHHGDLFLRPIAQGPRRLEASWFSVLKADTQE